MDDSGTQRVSEFPTVGAPPDQTCKKDANPTLQLKDTVHTTVPPSIEHNFDNKISKSSPLQNSHSTFEDTQISKNAFQLKDVNLEISVGKFFGFHSFFP